MNSNRDVSVLDKHRSSISYYRYNDGKLKNLPLCYSSGCNAPAGFEVAANGNIYPSVNCVRCERKFAEVQIRKVNSKIHVIVGISYISGMVIGGILTYFHMR